MTMKPLADRVLVKVEKEPESTTTAGGLVLAAKAQPGVPAKGEVIAVGDGKPTAHGGVVPMQVHVGDTVLFSQGAGQTIKLDGEELTMLYESEIWGIA